MASSWRIHVTSPLGALLGVGADTSLMALSFAAPSGAPDPRMAAWEGTPFGDPLGLQDCIDQWFGGDLQALGHLDLRPSGTPFQQSVWQAVAAIRPGHTLSYKDLAAAVGRKKAVRAVGAAVARNPLAIAIPCHRVVGARGQLTGYAWGLARKRSLLALEGALPSAAQQQLFQNTDPGVPGPTPRPT